MEKYILALDQGTTSSRAIVFDHQGSMIAVAQKEFKQYYPKPGWIEHDANEIWDTQLSVAQEVIRKAHIQASQIAAIGITNQRETTVVWDKESGEPIHKAIVWQDRRTSRYCDQLKEEGFEETIRNKTGLIADAYFSGTKVKWILENVPEARKKADQGKLAFGTIDSFLIWKLTGGKLHITDVTNASRTLLYDIHKMWWSTTITKKFDVPMSMLPQVVPSSQEYGNTDPKLLGEAIPIGGIAGDQQAALFGQMCTQPGMIKNTYGTGSFVVLNTGSKPIISKNNLLTTVAWQIEGKTTYALEGSIFIAGAIVQWLRDGLGIIKSSSEVESLANSVEDNGGVYLVPALTGLGAPHWDQYARGTIVGITRGTTAGHIARAALESIAYQAMDVLRAMQADSDIAFKELRVDGGATANNTLMQFQADLLKIPVVRPKVMETTALGAAYLAGLAVGYWKDLEEIQNQWQMDRTFEPNEKFNTDGLRKQWDKAIGRSKSWIED
ncbi:glycerol kinase GlpK [Catalinimonas niigatensis]|uniref:glycerol kinase GlpK n=1 Tax=Catalinimonas niigatensis TaxID=1397264 RepID=UPI002665DBBE|nr:glycerol kinase GlpK [Catalinimonas niigatensis]WPP49704.1 glycerol kinase GlpK [Catalinimonas niigatensis]